MYNHNEVVCLKLVRLSFNSVLLSAAVWTEAADKIDTESTRLHCSPSQ